MKLQTLVVNNTPQHLSILFIVLLGFAVLVKLKPAFVRKCNKIAKSLLDNIR
jgi:hypothetical protein